MNIFVTGANGYIGRNFIKKVTKYNHKIFAVTRKKNNKKIKNVKWLNGSIDKKWRELSKSNVLIHFGAVGVNEKFTNLESCFNFNVIKSTNLIFNAIQANCLKWVIISSSYEQKVKSLRYIHKTLKNKTRIPYFNYALTKDLFSKICLSLSNKNNIKCRIIKLFHVYGKDERKNRLWPSLIYSARKNKNLVITSGQHIYDFNHIDDIVDGLIQALNFKKKNKNFPQVWDMASGKEMSVKSFAKQIWKKLNPSSKLIFSKRKIDYKESYTINKKILWKLKYRKP